MVSRIRYPHILNHYLRGKKPFTYLIRVVLLVFIVWWKIQVALVVIFCGFAAGSFMRWFYFRVLVSRVPAKWRLKSIHDEGTLAPAASEHSALAADQAPADHRDDDVLL
jgi:hypothetical protein